MGHIRNHEVEKIAMGTAAPPKIYVKRLDYYKDSDFSHNYFGRCQRNFFEFSFYNQPLLTLVYDNATFVALWHMTLIF